jgi:hypothetical protein
LLINDFTHHFTTPHIAQNVSFGVPIFSWVGRVDLWGAAGREDDEDGAKDGRRMTEGWRG